MKYKHLFLVLSGLFCLHAFPAKAQSDVAVGQWKTYFSYEEGMDLLQMENAIWVATPNTLYSVNLGDGLCSRFGITEGLSDIGIAHIHAAEGGHSMLVCYENSDIDIYEDGRVYNMPDLFRKQVAGDKSIYQACVSGSRAYLACGFGILVVDMEGHYIRETWNFQQHNRSIPVKDVCLKGDTVFAATAEGIYMNTLSNRRIAQFSTWQKMNGLPEDMDAERVEACGDAVYAVRAAFIVSDTLHPDDTTAIVDVKTRNNALYVYSGGRWQLDSAVGYEEVRNIRTSRNTLVVTFWNKAVAYRASAGGLLKQEIAFGSSAPRNALLGEDGYLWLADNEHGLVRQLWTDQPQYYSLEGPLTDGVWTMCANRSTVAVLHEPPHEGWTPNWSHVKLSMYRDGRWSNTYFDVSHRAGMDVLLADERASEYYISSYLKGVMHVKDGKVTVYDTSNSSLESYFGAVRCGGMAMDSNANLWVLNPLAQHPLSVRTPKGAWHHFNVSYTSGDIIGNLLIDRRGWIWMTGNRETTLEILDTKGTLTNTADDEVVQLNTTLTEETGAFTYIYALAEDKDGEIWLGTDKGIKIYYTPSRLFRNPNSLPYAPRVTLDSLTELLLYHEAVTCIKVDQGNRKWVGTDNAGLFLLSEDGETEILHFTKENSPLISNNIRDIAILGSTGEVFVGTDKGLESFRYTATDAAEDYATLKVFPNPVREDFDGYISISGLVDDSEVKITDAKGGLVYRTKSNGGTAVWDGRRFDGSKAATGVYFVHATDPLGQFKGQGKILFVK